MSENKTKRILIVDDEPANCRTYQRIFQSVIAKQSVPASITTAENGQEGLDAVRADLTAQWFILTDIDMPVMNGLKFVRTLRTEFPDLRAMIVMHSGARVPDEVLIETLKLERFLPKPSENQVYIQCLQDFLSA